MKNSKNLLLTGILMLAAAVAAPSAFADGGHGKKAYGDGDSFFYTAHKLIKKQEKLGLTDEQVSAIRSLKLETKKDLVRQKSEIDIAKLDLKSRMAADANADELKEIVDRKYELKKEMAKSLIDANAKLKQTVSAEQWKQVKDWQSGKYAGYGMEKPKDLRN